MQKPLESQVINKTIAKELVERDCKRELGFSILVSKN